MVHTKVVELDGSGTLFFGDGSGTHVVGVLVGPGGVDVDMVGVFVALRLCSRTRHRCSVLGDPERSRIEVPVAVMFFGLGGHPSLVGILSVMGVLGAVGIGRTGTWRLVQPVINKEAKMEEVRQGGRRRAAEQGTWRRSATGGSRARRR